MPGGGYGSCPDPEPTPLTGGPATFPGGDARPAVGLPPGGASFTPRVRAASWFADSASPQTLQPEKMRVQREGDQVQRNILPEMSSDQLDGTRTA